MVPLRRKLDILFAENIFLPDLHTGNVLLKLDARGRIRDATPVDFGAVIEGYGNILGKAKYCTRRVIESS